MKAAVKSAGSRPASVITAGWSLVCVVLFLAPARAQLKKQPSIRPGVGLVNLKLGASRATAEKALGAPTKINHLKNGLTEAYWLLGRPSYSPGATLLFERDKFKHDKIVQIETALPQDTSPGGISIDSNFRTVLKRYKNLRASAYGWMEIDGGAGYVRYYYDAVKAGIAFTLGTQDDEATSEYMFTAFTGTDAVKPRSIIVHLPGHPVIAATGEARVIPEEVAATLQPSYLYAVLKAKRL